MNPGVAFPREYRWACSLGIGKDSGAGWDAKLAVGFSIADTDVMNDTTGAITVGTGTGQWVSDGGFLFNIEPDGELRFYINSASGGLQALGPVNLATWLGVATPYLRHLQVGIAWSSEDTEGNGFTADEGRLKAYYRIPSGNELEIYGPWIQIGAEVVGHKLPQTGAAYSYLHEVVNGSTTAISLFDDWCAGGITREMLLP